MLELYQAEWCPYSHAVRQRLTELGVDYVVRQVPPSPEDRDALREVSGQDSIPVVVLDDGTVLAGESDEIIAQLDAKLPEGRWADGHREQAASHARVRLKPR